jgi:P27 family predicted phage terminase small subunit
MGGKGSGGHNRKTAAVKKAEGNAGKRAINEREPVAPPADAEAPVTLSPLEREFWIQIFPIVSQMQIMRSSDVLALTQLCRFLAEERECTKQLSTMGRLIPKKDDEGKVIGVSLNPIARLRSDAARHVRAYLAVFGLGPSFRAALQADNPDDQPSDPLDNVRRAKTASDIVQ